ncbi:Uncharacterized protein SCF082_LOCUS33888 [Durusdinium trenchii]|uniref:Uncharacterized protein n=1 Tax=Durusdinium trenchii TaxID=1381693 RepID=A0ABP0NT19_9DINO
MDDYTLNIPEVQIVVNYPHDGGGYFWHHRILLHRIEGGTWLTLTPDHDIQRHDLTTTRHRILDRAAPFPEDIAGEIYAHDVIGKATLDGYKRQAVVQAAILGEGSVGESEAFVWLVTEHGHELFGKEVDQALLRNGATGVAFSSKGVIILDGEEVFVEKVGRNGINDWRKRRGLDMSDERLLGDFKDEIGKRNLELVKAVPLMKEPTIADFSISGTRAAREFLESIAGGAHTLLTYHSEWLRSSGVGRKSSAAHVHRGLMESLRLMISFDQLDPSALAVGEHLCRWAIQTELAVERCPSAPDYTGLDIVSGSSLLPDGRANTTKFTEFLAQRLKDRASQKAPPLHPSEGDMELDATGAIGPPDSEDVADAWFEFSVRRPSPHRRHGDPFPLPSSLPLTDVQRWVMEDISRRVEAMGPCPDDLTEDLAVKELGKGANLYEQAADNYNLAEFDIDKIKILKRKLDPALARELAPPEVQGFLDNFDTLIQRPVGELDALASSGTLVEPYWDPKLKRSLGKRKQLYKALYDSNLLTFVRRRKARVGFFTVKKKDSWIRLILDARQSNACHRCPPQAKLGTPAGLASIDLSHRTLESRGFSFVDSEDGLPTAITGDVGDCFYNFVIPAASEWFCTDDVFSIDDIHAMGIQIEQVFDSRAGGWTTVDTGEKLYPAFYGMPMGWSWSLWIANEIIICPGRKNVYVGDSSDKGYALMVTDAAEAEVTLFLTHLQEDLDSEVSAGTYLVYGLQLLRCTGNKSDFLTESKEALKGWRKRRPGNMRLPVPEEFVYDLATLALDQNRVDLAMLLTVQMDAYLRPSEALDLTKAHLARPNGALCHWSTDAFDMPLELVRGRHTVVERQVEEDAEAKRLWKEAEKAWARQDYRRAISFAEGAQLELEWLRAEVRCHVALRDFATARGRREGRNGRGPLEDTGGSWKDGFDSNPSFQDDTTNDTSFEDHDFRRGRPSSAPLLETMEAVAMGVEALPSPQCGMVSDRGGLGGSKPIPKSLSVVVLAADFCSPLRAALLARRAQLGRGAEAEVGLEVGGVNWVNPVSGNILWGGVAWEVTRADARRALMLDANCRDAQARVGLIAWIGMDGMNYTKI